MTAARRLGSRVAKQWWDQDGLDLEGIRTADQEAERADDEEEETDGAETD